MIQKIRKSAIIFFVVITCIHFITRCIAVPKQFLQQDRFGELFKNFIELNYYTNVQNGTSPIYGIFLNFLANLGLKESLCFISINILSQMYILVMGVLIIRKIEVVNKWIRNYTMFIFCYLILESHLFMYGFNDMLLGAVVVTCIYNVLYGHSKNVYIKLGVLLSIALSIRITGVFLLFFIIYRVYLDVGKKEFYMKSIIFFLIPFIMIISIIHYPSIIQKGSLSFHSKEPDLGVTWVQRNTLGLKKLLNGETKSYGNNSIWQETKFPEVVEYLKKNGKDSLPKNIGELVVKEPFVFLFIVVRNLVYEFLWVIRFSGIVFLYVFFSKIPFYNNKGAILLAIIMFLLASASGSFFEARWFTGYKVLLFVGPLIALSKSKLSINKQDLVFAGTLVLISIFNLKTIYSTYLHF